MNVMMLAYILTFFSLKLSYYLKTPLEDLLSLGTADRAVDGDLFVPTDAERSDGVAGLGEDGRLARQLLQHLGGTGQTITGLANADVEAQLANLHLPHGVLGLLVGHHHPDGLSVKCFGLKI